MTFSKKGKVMGERCHDRGALFFFAAFPIPAVANHQCSSVNNTTIPRISVTLTSRICVIFEYGIAARKMKTMADWDETKARLKEKIAGLANNNLFLAKGQKDEVLARLEAKLGQTREAIIKILSDM